MKTSITILGRKTDLLLLAGIIILTVFITINTLCNCKNCEKEESCCDKATCSKKKISTTCVKNKPNLPIQSNIVGADEMVYEGDLSL